MLAINGGSPVRNIKTNPWPKWPIWDREEKRAIIEVLNSGIWSYNGSAEKQFNMAWCKYIRSNYSILVANGTTALVLALEALNIGYGDEVIVPGLTWQATAASVIDVNAVPILVDVEPDTWCISPSAVEAAITERTRAIIPVHLYGSIADMDSIMSLATKKGIHVIEDASHQHGTLWNNKRIGTIGNIGCFSLQLSKILTGGEGGIIITDDKDLWLRLDSLRNCGRVPVDKSLELEKSHGFYIAEGNLIQSGNYRITEFQAAVLLQGLKRLPEQNKIRDKNALYLNEKLKYFNGLSPPKRDHRVSEQAYFSYAFRYQAEEFGGLPIKLFRAALQAELGCIVGASYEPLNNCSLYKPQTKKRYRINDEHWKAIDPTRFSLPESEAIFKEHSVTMHHSILLGDLSDMDQILEAIDKIHSNIHELEKIEKSFTKGGN